MRTAPQHGDHRLARTSLSDDDHEAFNFVSFVHVFDRCAACNVVAKTRLCSAEPKLGSVEGDLI
jgi:hypothetical protein